MAHHSQPGGVARPCAARSAALADWEVRVALASPHQPVLNMTVRCSFQPGRVNTALRGLAAGDVTGPDGDRADYLDVDGRHDPAAVDDEVDDVYLKTDDNDPTTMNCHNRRQ